MTEFEKRIYNCWLATTRSNTDKPFKLRKDWTGFEDKPEYNYVKKLASLFKKYDNIDMDDWFKAPYVVYPEKIQYDLPYYTIMKSYNNYRLFIQKRDNTSYTQLEFRKKLYKDKNKS